MVSEPLQAPEGIVRFGEGFELDVRAYELRCCGRVLKLERIPMELLLLLLEYRGQLVTREQIVERIWGKNTFLDTNNSINGAIRKIRLALKDDPEEGQFVQTVSGKGYRFVAQVTAPADTSTVAPEPRLPVHSDAPENPGKRPFVALVGIALALIAALAGLSVWFRPTAGSPPSGQRPMLAILPFVNLTGDPGQEYVSDGLTEELISTLSNLAPQRLGVIARTSVMHYKNHQASLSQLASELGVQYVLEGSLRRDGPRVRIAAQLVQVSDQSHLWARQYERELSGLLEVQAEIARAIADEIPISFVPRATLAPPAQPSSPASHEAYDLYLQGRYFWNKRTPEGYRRAVEYFERSTAKDPNYARAYAGLADCYALMSSYGLGAAGELGPKARAAARRALELDETLAEAHASLALIHQNHEWDWSAADADFRRAVQLNPNYATGSHWYAESLAFQGRFDEALAAIDRARQLDPLSLIIATDRGVILYYARQYDRAIEQLEGVLASDPAFPRAHMLAFVYVEKGRFAEALEVVKRWRTVDDMPWTWSVEAYVYGRWGRLAEARRALREFEQANRDKRLQPAVFLATAYAGMGERERAIAWLQKAYEERSNALAGLKVEPSYDLLRDDPRFQDLLRHVGLRAQ